MLTNKHYKYGAFLGKFYPLHRGHQFAIDTMISMCDNSMVLCYPSPHEKISPQAREDALKYLYKDKCKIKVISDDGILNDVFESNYFWEYWLAALKRDCPHITCLFGSEEYVRIIAEKMGIDFHLVDVERINFNVSGTKIRNRPFVHYDYISSPLKYLFNKRIVIVGAESSGKSTLIKQLSHIYCTNTVSEYGRDYVGTYWKKTDLTEVLEKEDYLEIARVQLENEDTLNKKANKILFCDTEQIATASFAKMYSNLDLTEELINTFDKERYFLHFLIYPDLEFFQDDTRVIEDNERRIEHFNFLKDIYEKLGIRMRVIKGQDKLLQMQNIIDEEIKYL